MHIPIVYDLTDTNDRKPGLKWTKITKDGTTLTKTNKILTC